MPNKLEEKDWDRLLQRIKAGKCTPFIGSEVLGRNPYLSAATGCNAFAL